MSEISTVLGSVRLRYKGPHNPASEYSFNDLVSANGGSYAYINHTPAADMPLTDTSHWQQIASMGGQDLVDAAVAARDAAKGYKDAAAASALQLASGVASPAGTYASLAALTTANPAHDKIYVVTADGKWYYWSGSAWAAGGVYQAASVAADIEHINSQLAETVQKQVGLNKFGGEYLNVVVLSDGTYRLDENCMSAIIPVEEGNTYYFRKDTGNRSRLGFLGSTPDPTSTPKPLLLYVGDIVSGTGYTAPTGATHLIYTVSNALIDPPKLQITENNDTPFFVGYDFIKQENVSGLIVEISNLKDIPKQTSTVLYGNAPILSFDYTNKTVKITTGTRVFYKGKRTIIANENELIPMITEGSSSPNALYYDATDSKVKLQQIGVSTTLPDTLICIFSVVKPEVYGLDIENCEVDGQRFIYPHIAKYFFLEDIDGIYNKPSGIPSGETGTDLDLITSNSNLIYGIYDDLVSRYPEYVSKRLVGNETTGLPIYEYRFISPDMTNNSSYPYKKLKLLVLSAIHGYEQGSAYSMAMFFKDLCENHATKEQLNFMKWNVDFVVIPVANPWGYNNNSRVNSNGVDLNRNFPAGWSLGTVGDNYYGGESPASEIETQLLISVIAANTDAEWFIDYHNNASGYPLFYLYDSEVSTIAFNTFKTLSRKWANDYPSAPQDGTIMGYVSTGVNACCAKYAIVQHGIKSFVFETPWKIPFAMKKYDKITLETGTEAFGNTIVTILKSLR